MPTLIPAVVRWAFLHVVRQPATWVAVPLLAAVWPLVEHLHPLGITTQRRDEPAALYELAFVTALVAAVVAQDLLARAEPLLTPAGPVRRALAEVSAHLAIGSLYLLPVLGVAWFTEAPRSAFVPARLPLAVLLTVLHLGALALVVRSLPLSRTLRSAALPLLAWALPALVTATTLGYDLLAALDAGRHLELAFESRASGPQRMAAGLPIIGWSAVGLLMTRPHPHALRRSR